MTWTSCRIRRFSSESSCMLVLFSSLWQTFLGVEFDGALPLGMTLRVEVDGALPLEMTSRVEVDGA